MTAPFITPDEAEFQAWKSARKANRPKPITTPDEAEFQAWKASRNTGSPSNDVPLLERVLDSGTSFGGRVLGSLASFGHELVTNPVRTIGGMVTAPLVSAGRAAIAPGVGDRRPDPRLSKGGNSSGRPIDTSPYDAEHGGVTPKDRAIGALQTGANLAFPALGPLKGGILAGAAYDPTDPLVGATVGGLIGGTAHVAAKVPGKVLDYTGARPSEAKPSVRGRAANAAGVSTTEQRSLESLVARLDRAKVTPDQLRARAAEARELGKPASMMEVGGQPIARMARAIEGIPSEGAETVRRALEGRRRGAAARVASDVESGLGQPRADMFEATQSLVEQQKAKAAPFYERAMSAGPLSLDVAVPGKQLTLAELLRRPSAQKAIGYETQLASEEGRPAFPNIKPNPILESMAPEARAKVVELAKAQGENLGGEISMAQLHNLKLRMDEMLGYAKAKGSLPDGTPATSKMLRAIQDTKNDLLAVMDAHSPDYKAGRKSWAGDAELQDALALGHDFLNKKRPLGELKHEMAQLSEAGQEQVRRGVVSAVRDMIDSARDGADVASRIFGNETQRRYLRAAFKDDASFERFRRQMEGDVGERPMAANENMVLGGSRTAPMLGDVQDLLETRAPQGGNLLTWRGAANAALRRVDFLREGVASRARADALAPLVTAGAHESVPLTLEDVIGMTERHRAKVAPKNMRGNYARNQIAGGAARGDR